MEDCLSVCDLLIAWLRPLVVCPRPLKDVRDPGTAALFGVDAG